jgi:hypothetical protein
MDKFEGLPEIDGLYDEMYKDNWHHMFSLIHWIMIIGAYPYVISNDGPMINNNEIVAEYRNNNIIVKYEFKFTNPQVEIHIQV